MHKNLVSGYLQEQVGVLTSRFCSVESTILLQCQILRLMPSSLNLAARPTAPLAAQVVRAERRHGAVFLQGARGKIVCRVQVSTLIDFPVVIGLFARSPSIGSCSLLHTAVAGLFCRALFQGKS